MKTLQLNNQSLMLQVVSQAILKNPSSAGSSVNLTCDDNNDFAQNDFVLIGDIGKGQSEIFKVGAVVTPGTIIQADSLVFSHNVGDPVYKVPYDKIKVYHADTVSGTKTLLTTLDIDADNEYTNYLDSVNSTGFAFFTFFNSQTTEETGYSAGFSYTTATTKSRIKIREFVSSPHNYSNVIDENTFNQLCDFAEAEIFSIKNWRFREKIVAFNTVVSQQSYTKAEMGVSDMGKLVYVTYDGEPVTPITLRDFRMLNWNSVVQTGRPTTVCEFEGKFYFTPTPSEIKEVKLYYYKNSSGFADETDETDVKLPQAVGFRVLQDLWATSDPQNSKMFEARYLQVIQAMKVDDESQVSKFRTLSDSKYNNHMYIDQVQYPNRIS